MKANMIPTIKTILKEFDRDIPQYTHIRSDRKFAEVSKVKDFIRRVYDKARQDTVLKGERRRIISQLKAEAIEEESLKCHEHCKQAVEEERQRIIKLLK